MDLHITVRGWHLVLALIGLVVLHSAYPARSTPGTDDGHGRRGVRRGVRREAKRGRGGGEWVHRKADRKSRKTDSEPQLRARSPSPRLVDFQVLPPSDEILGQKAPFEGSAGDRNVWNRVELTNVSTGVLARELHGRQYSWETLRGAGLRFSNFTALELLWWLRRDRTRFREVLKSTQLGLGTHTSTELLRELGRREDLGETLLTSGLGAGTDFNCKEDESPRDSGCQIKCSNLACARGHQVCCPRPRLNASKPTRDRGYPLAKCVALHRYARRSNTACVST